MLAMLANALLTFALVALGGAAIVATLVGAVVAAMVGADGRETIELPARPAGLALAAAGLVLFIAIGFAILQLAVQP